MYVGNDGTSSQAAAAKNKIPIVLQLCARDSDSTVCFAALLLPTDRGTDRKQNQRAIWRAT
ncbi:hypothetical protein D3C86_1823710 [compost metagenome]